VDTMLYTNEHGEVCPAGWNQGDAAMTASTDGVADYLAKHEGDL
ncbi:MAG: peroxiredoxin, partial [Sulfurimonadaceae bacterium]|nr:peroxiredoxin [Sulfurimonadaceae bacterium]